MAQPLYATDGEISKPGLPPSPILIELGSTGFGFTRGGIAHVVNAADLEELVQPTFGPMLDI